MLVLLRYAETKYVAFAIVAHLQTKLIFILAAVFSFGSPIIFFLVKLLTLTASDLGTMLLLIVPKMAVVHTTKGLDGHVKQRMQAAKNKLLFVAIQKQTQGQPEPLADVPTAVAVPVVLTEPPGAPPKPLPPLQPAPRPTSLSQWNSDAASMSARREAGSWSDASLSARESARECVELGESTISGSASL